MNMISASAAASATASLSLAPDTDIPAAVFAAAQLLLPNIERGQRIDAATPVSYTHLTLPTTPYV